MATATRWATKTDLSKVHPSFFNGPREPEVVDLPEASYLTLPGEGVPEQAMPAVIGAVYPVVYTVKMKLKAAGRDFKVCPIEAQWWVIDADGRESSEITNAPADAWRWRLLLMVPDFVTAEDVEAARSEQTAKKQNPLIERVELVRVREGLAVQMMHTGPYDAEAPTIARMWAFIRGHGLQAAGRHHEIYLGDPRRTKPERLRTLLRQPVRRLA